MQGKPISRRAYPTDTDEIVPGSQSPRSMRLRRPGSAAAGRADPPPGQNRDGTWRPLSDSSPANPAYARFAEHAADEYDEFDVDPADAAHDPYVALKEKLFALIVEHRIFREAAIRKLLDKAKQINAHMNQARLDRVLEEVRRREKRNTIRCGWGTPCWCRLQRELV